MITDWATPAQALDAALAGSGLIHFTRNDPRLDVTIHREAGQEDKLIVFLANPTADPISAKLCLDPQVKSAQELWSDEKVTVKAGVFSENLPPYTIRIYECAI